MAVSLAFKSVRGFVCNLLLSDGLDDSQLEQTTSAKLVGNLPMVTRASAVACAVDGRVFPVPVPTS